jgi:hypothetical protein
MICYYVYRTEVLESIELSVSVSLCGRTVVSPPCWSCRGGLGKSISY